MERMLPLRGLQGIVELSIAKRQLGWARGKKKMWVEREQGGDSSYRGHSSAHHHISVKVVANAVTER
jgi:hypothetical protein